MVLVSTSRLTQSEVFFTADCCLLFSALNVSVFCTLIFTLFFSYPAIFVHFSLHAPLVHKVPPN